jgi:cell division septal protein FtsQ
MKRRPVVQPPRPALRRRLDRTGRETSVASQTHPARRQRRRRRLLRAAARAAGLGLALAAFAVAGSAALHAVRTASVFAVTRVDVDGVERLTEADVVAAARIEPGESLLALDPDAVVDRVEALPGVRRARVTRHLPDRVVVTVEERAPYALIVVGGALAWVDVDGRLVGPERRPVPPPLPVLSGVEPPAAGPDQPVGDRLRAGLAVLRAIQRAGGRLGGRISEVDLAGAGGPVLYTLEGVEVRLPAEGWDEQLARFDGVLAELEDRGERAGLVDLRYRDLVVIRPQGVI